MDPCGLINDLGKQNLIITVIEAIIFVNLGAEMINLKDLFLSRCLILVTRTIFAQKNNELAYKPTYIG